jgi:hypothetical protein
MSWITSLLAKYLGPSFVKRAASTVTVFVVGLIGKYLPGVNPEAVQKFSEGFLEIVGLAIGLILGLLIDAKFSKPDMPKIVKK